MFNNTTPFTMPVVPVGYTSGGNGGNGMFGGDGWWALIIILALFGGFGRGGFGGGGLGGFGGGGNCATPADLTTQSILQKLDGQTYGLADSTYALNNAINNGFNGVQQTLCQGFNGVNTAILQSANGAERGFNSLSHQLADCCCENRAAIADVKYQMATQACETRQAIADSTRSVLDFLVQDKLATLQAENQTLKFAASQSRQNDYLTATMQAQTAEIIRRTGSDCPIPAYVVQPPAQVTFPVNCCGQFTGYNNGYNNGCGCA